MSAIEWPETPRGKLTISGAEPPLPPMIADFQKTLHDFALKVMRPVGAKLDRMSADEVIAPGSPYWDFRKQYLDLGIGMETLGSLSAEDFSLMFPIIFEELGYGDAGLAISMGCLLYTSDAADERSSVALGGRRIIKKKKKRGEEEPA